VKLRPRPVAVAIAPESVEVEPVPTATEEPRPLRCNRNARPRRRKGTPARAEHDQAIPDGDRKIALLTPAEEVALAKRIKRGDREARNHMIQANLRLVVKIAHDYKDFGPALLDLISEATSA